MIPQNLEDLRNIALAAERLVRCKGRYHSELNMVALAALFGVKLPPPQLAASGSVPPLSTVCPKDILTDEHPYTYTSTQATNCAQCGEYKHTPLRIDAMDGYVCLTCIDKRLEGFFDAEQQRAAVGAGAAELPEPALWQFRWLNPANQSNAEGHMQWEPVAVWMHHQTLEQRIQELRDFRYQGKPVYEVRALFAAPLGAVAVDAAPQQTKGRGFMPNDEFNGYQYIRQL